jgi:ADP-heptose:LPS heptosyltransferase
LKILIIRLSSIGDIILTSPAIKYAKMHMHAETHYLTKKNNHSLVNQNPYIDKVFLFDNNLSEIISQLREEKYDKIIDLHNNLRSFIIKSRLRISSSTLDKFNFSKWMMVKLKRKIEVPHIVKRYLKTVDINYNIEFADNLEFYSPSKPTGIDFAKLPEYYYCISLGAKHFTKKIPVSLAVKIIKKIDFRAVLIGGKDVIEESLLIEKECNVINLCGKLSMAESAYMIEKSRLLVCSDTGMMHLAAAINKEVHVIWGNTVPEFGMYAYYGKNVPKSFNYEVELKCRPCSRIGFNSCPERHFKCMENQDIEAIVRNISESLALVNR